MTNNLLTEERRKRFESLTLDIVKQDIAAGSFTHIGAGDAKRAALLWIEEQESKRNEIESQRHAQNINVAKGAIFISIISLIISIIALFK